MGIAWRCQAVCVAHWRPELPKILERLRPIVADKISVEEEAVVPEATFTEDLGADSLDVVEMIMALEEEFGTEDNPLEISDEEAGKIATVQQAVDLLREKGVADTEEASAAD